MKFPKFRLGTNAGRHRHPSLLATGWLRAGGRIGGLAAGAVAAALALGALGIVSLPRASAGATTLYVASGGSDSGSCDSSPCATISYAVSQAASGDTISVGPGTFTDDVTLGANLTIQGTVSSGALQTTVAGAVSGEDTFTIASGTTATLQDLVIQGNNATGVDNQGTLTVDSSTVTATSSSTTYQGGILSTGPQLTVTDSTITGADAGTGVDVEAGTAAISDSTLSNNNIGLTIGGSGVVTNLSADTIADNAAVGISTSSGSTANLTRDLLYGNGSGENCDIRGSLSDNGYNLSSDSSCAFTAVGSAEDVSPASGQATYVPMSPVRVLDTRIGLGFPAIVSDGQRTLQITGRDGIPTSGVTAVVANVTVTQATSAGYLSLFPAGGSVPPVSNLNFSAAETVANLVTVPLSSSGALGFYSHLSQPTPAQVLLVLDGNPSGGTVQVVMDIQGYYQATGSFGSGLYVPLSSPVRVADTRPGSGQPDAGRPLAPASTTALTVTGGDGVPSDASAVVLNLTVADPTSEGYLTVFPAGSARPEASNLNFTEGEQLSNRVIADIGSSGQIEIYNYTGRAELVVDIDGYYTGAGEIAPADAGAFTAITPVRIVDTRSGLGGGPLAAQSSESLSVSGVGTIPAESQTGPFTLAANVTAIPQTGPGYVTVYPEGQAAPPTSDVNWSNGGQAQPNFTLMGALSDSGQIAVLNGSAGPVELLVDVFGYFAAPPSGQ